MRTRSKVKSAAALLTLCVAASPALASSTSVSFSGRVPTICRVTMSGTAPAVFQAGDNRLGSANELCNSVDGYRIVLSHPSGLRDAWVLVDGARIAISPSATSTVIVDSSHPMDGARELGLHLSEPVDGPLPLSLHAEARGMTF